MGISVGNPLVDELIRRYGAGNVMASGMKEEGYPEKPGPGMRGWAASYAQGPLPPQPPVEYISNGEPRLKPFDPSPRFVPPPTALPPIAQALNAPMMASQVPAVKAINTAAPVVQGQDVTPGQIDPRLAAMLRSLMPGHGFTTSPQAFGMNPANILRRSQGMPPIPPPVPAGRGISTGDAIRAHQMLRGLNTPTPQGLSGLASNDTGTTQAERDAQQAWKRQTGQY